MDDKPLKPINIPITGKLKTSVDGCQLSEGDFQVLQNMRYTNAGIKSISGMTKINTSTTELGNFLKFRAGIHFVKDEPSESHVLVQAWDTGITPHIYRYDTAIPGTWTFNSTILYTESSGAGIGTFSTAPDGCVAYCNGKESLIWGGDEYRVGAFYNYNPDNSFVYNYSKVINNTLQTTGNTAVLKQSPSTLDGTTVLLLHMDGTDTSTTFTDDSTVTPHIVTANGNAQIDTADKKFGTASGIFDGTGDYLTIPANADFDFSDGTWTIDFWFKSNNIATTQTIYFEGNSSTDYMRIYLADSKLRIGIFNGIDYMTMYSNILSSSTWYHAEIVENGNNWYIFINGNSVGSYLVGSISSIRPVNYTGDVRIGGHPYTSDNFNGWLDEFRISTVVRHTTNFPVPTEAYSNTTITYAYLNSQRPLQGLKFYIKTANTATATASISYWNGVTWAAVSNFIDNTVVSGKTLAKTGTNIFDSTVLTAKIKILYDSAAYWYLISWKGIDQNTEIYYTTVDAPMQPIIDIWDGVPRVAYSFFKYAGGKYIDNTFNVINNSYTEADVTTYVELDSLATSGYIVAGFQEPQMGIKLHLVPNHVNTTANTITTLSYWNGTAWVSVGSIDDGTQSGGGSVSQSGVITYQVIVQGTEQTTTISTNDTPLYYYKLNFSQALSADVQLYYVAGIPAQKTIANYKFPVNYHNRLWLCSDQSGERNKIAVSSTGTVSIFNGTDTTNFYIGDNTDMIAGGSLYGRYASSISEQLILCKIDETWLIEGTALSNYSQFRVSNQYGCVAAKTFTICNVAYTMASGISKHVAIWQSSNAIVVFDGSTVMPVSFDISDVFDQRNTLSNGTPFRIDLSMIHKSTAFYDEANSEWHWSWSSDGSTLNNEYVYDLIRQKWYTINRGVAIQLGIPVRDTNGNKYVYGAIDTGYLERLENGNTFDGNNIISKFRTPDIPIAGWEEESLIRKVSLLTKTKATTTNTVAITHYGDMANTGTSIGNLSVTDATKRVRRSMMSIGTGPYTFHSFECSMTTSDEPIGFEPIGLQIFYKAIRPHLI